MKLLKSADNEIPEKRWMIPLIEGITNPINSTQGRSNSISTYQDITGSYGVERGNEVMGNNNVPDIRSDITLWSNRADGKVK